ncbi:glycosyltransferase family 4 protein [Candidatus Uhrbacteria bacterium]|nr:glycosyltransferase family 4 protein [Candidatus Uhrbacteria bacterium]
MKVLHLSCVAPPQIGGIGKVAAQEVGLLRARGVEAELVSVVGARFPRPGLGDPAPTEYIKFLPTLWQIGNASMIAPWKLLPYLKRADVVHLHYPFYGTDLEIDFFKFLGAIKKLVVTLHMDADVSGWRGAVNRVHRHTLQELVLHSADALLVSSLDYAEHSSYKKFIMSPKMHELPFGVDEERFAPGERNPAKFGIPSDAKVVTFVGGMDKPHAFKGVDVLLKAFKQLPQNTWMVLGGEGELRPEFEKLANELGVADRVKFVGRVAEKDLPDVYRVGDVFAFPSTSGAEAFGLVALEAQACGVPVVASDLPGVRTVVEDRVTGLLTPAGNVDELAAHLRLILENHGMRDEMGTAARKRVLEKFTWTKHVEGLMEIYENI